jgi:hypothetical protein
MNKRHIAIFSFLFYQSLLYAVDVLKTQASMLAGKKESVVLLSIDRTDVLLFQTLQSRVEKIIEELRAYLKINKESIL